VSGSFLPARARADGGRPVAARPPGASRRSWTPGERLVNRLPDPERRPDAPLIGVLALQGDVLEHLRAVRRCGADAVQVRTLEAFEQVDGLIVPGGESTTIGKLLTRFGMMDRIRAGIAAGLPVFGTCAGMILLSDELDQPVPQPLLGGLHVRTRRNAFGRQLDSFDTRLEVQGIDGGPMDVAFIRAPRVEEVLADDVEVLATVDGFPVVIRQGRLLAAAFHPEVTGDDRLHAAFVATVRAANAVPG
jgi:pyridoxal 5'-phosphate synthase pdxT subunit